MNGAIKKGTVVMIVLVLLALAGFARVSSKTPKDTRMQIMVYAPPDHPLVDEIRNILNDSRYNVFGDTKIATHMDVAAIIILDQYTDGLPMQVQYIERYVRGGGGLFIGPYILDFAHSIVTEIFPMVRPLALSGTMILGDTANVSIPGYINNSAAIYDRNISARFTPDIMYPAFTMAWVQGFLDENGNELQDPDERVYNVSLITAIHLGSGGRVILFTTGFNDTISLFKASIRWLTMDVTKRWVSLEVNPINIVETTKVHVKIIAPEKVPIILVVDGNIIIANKSEYWLQFNSTGWHLVAAVAGKDGERKGEADVMVFVRPVLYPEWLISLGATVLLGAGSVMIASPWLYEKKKIKWLSKLAILARKIVPGGENATLRDLTLTWALLLFLYFGFFVLLVNTFIYYGWLSPLFKTTQLTDLVFFGYRILYVSPLPLVVTALVFAIPFLSLVILSMETTSDVTADEKQWRYGMVVLSISSVALASFLSGSIDVVIAGIITVAFVAAGLLRRRHMVVYTMMQLTTFAIVAGAALTNVRDINFLNIIGDKITITAIGLLVTALLFHLFARKLLILQPVLIIAMFIYLIQSPAGVMPVVFTELASMFLLVSITMIYFLTFSVIAFFLSGYFTKDLLKKLAGFKPPVGKVLAILVGAGLFYLNYVGNYIYVIDLIKLVMGRPLNISTVKSVLSMSSQVVTIALFAYSTQRLATQVARATGRLFLALGLATFNLGMAALFSYSNTQLEIFGNNPLPFVFGIVTSIMYKSMNAIMGTIGFIVGIYILWKSSKKAPQ